MLLLRRRAVLALVITGLVCIWAGCDLTREETDIGPLLGSWRTTDLSVDGISLKAQLDAQYDRLILTLREGADGGEFFTIIGREEGTKEDLFVQGTFDVDREELDLFPDEGPHVEFDYAVPDSLGDSRLHLIAEEGASEDLFIDLIRVPIQGAVDQLALRLSKGARSTDESRTRP